MWSPKKTKNNLLNDYWKNKIIGQRYKKNHTPKMATLNASKNYIGNQYLGTRKLWEPTRIYSKEKGEIF
jgi:hypothetical protein